ncbi:MAG: TIM barrel protein [Bacteroidota bacterium]
MNRRKAIRNATLGLAASSIGSALSATEAALNELSTSAGPTAATNHSVCRWCYDGIPFEEFADSCVDLGIKSIELTRPDEWEVLKSRGLTCAMGTFEGFSISDAFNDPANHAFLLEKYQEIIPKAADAGVPSVIAMSGNRRRLTDYEGMINCAKGLEPVVKLAEEAGVVIQMELLNSKVNHPDYMCDRTEWGVALCEMIGSPNFKLLYDIYHMQIMEGDVIATIQEYQDYIGHYHTGGVPGRNEINDSQELNYPAIIKAIHETGFEGYIAQEFIPTYEDKIAALREGIMICA